MTRSGGFRAHALAALALLIMLTGCTAPDPEPTESAVPSPTSTPVQPDPEPTRAAASVTLAAVDVDGLNLTVGGLVIGLDEEAGTCRYVLRSGLDGREVVKETAGVSNAGNTSCGAVQVPIAELSKGPWTVVLEYAGAEQLTSDPVEVEVP